MAYRKTKMGSLIDVNARAATHRIVKAYKRCAGHHGMTAEQLGVGRITLARWVRQLRLTSVVKQVRRQHASERRALIVQAAFARGSVLGRPRGSVAKKTVASF